MDPRREDISDEELRRIEGRWKSDVDLKLDRLVKFAADYEHLLALLSAREQKRLKLWDAVIEKTTAGLLWAGIAFIAASVWEYVKSVKNGSG